VGRNGNRKWIIHKKLDAIRRMESTQSSCTHTMARTSHATKRGTRIMAPLASASRKRTAQAMESAVFENEIEFDDEEVSQY